jgi:CRISPR-associated protein Cmr3
MVHLTRDDPQATWPAVPALDFNRITLNEHTGLRLLLVTPALFTHGWLPAWMADGVIPGLGGSKVQVNLTGVATDRHISVSGWQLTRNNPASSGTGSGPRANRYAVPAGTVLFFNFASGTPTREQLTELWHTLWLHPVSDRGLDCNEGFGLVLPGLWHDTNQ